MRSDAAKTAIEQSAGTHAGNLSMSKWHSNCPINKSNHAARLNACLFVEAGG
jgi:hypothetical protein